MCLVSSSTVFSRKLTLYEIIKIMSLVLSHFRNMHSFLVFVSPYRYRADLQQSVINNSYYH